MYVICLNIEIGIIFLVLNFSLFLMFWKENWSACHDMAVDHAYDCKSTYGIDQVVVYNISQ